MTQAKFTKGPWAISSRGLENDGSAIVVTKATLPDEYHTRIAAVAIRDPDAPRKNRHTYECAERDANARLIAAAPELYDATQAALASDPLRTGGEHVAISRATWDAMTAALAKATP